MGLFSSLFGKKEPELVWNQDGWTDVRENDHEKHILGISVRAEKGMIVEVRTRHSQGEEVKGEVTLDGKNVLPISVDEFKKLYEEGKLLIK